MYKVTELIIIYTSSTVLEQCARTIGVGNTDNYRAIKIQQFERLL